MPRRFLRKPTAISLTCLLLAGLAACDSHAQRAREVLGGLSRDLIESELEKQQEKQASNGRPPATASRSAKVKQAQGYFEQFRGLRKEISALIDAMRQDLGVQLAFDRRTVNRLAAELEGIAEQAQFHLGQWQRRPGASVDADLLRDAQQLTRDCQRLHEQCAGRATQEHLARDCRQLAEDWSCLRPRLLACDGIEGQALRRIADKANARLVRLQVMLDN